MRAIPIAQLTFQEFANAGCSVSPALAISPQNNGFPSGFYSIADMRTSIDYIGNACSKKLQKLPGMIDVLELDHPGMHTTDTVDFNVNVSGEVISNWLGR